MNHTLCALGDLTNIHLVTMNDCLAPDETTTTLAPGDSLTDQKKLRNLKAQLKAAAKVSRNDEENKEEESSQEEDDNEIEEVSSGQESDYKSIAEKVQPHTDTTISKFTPESSCMRGKHTLLGQKRQRSPGGEVKKIPEPNQKSIPFVSGSGPSV